MVSIWAVPTVHKMGFLLYSVRAGASVVSVYASACQSQDTCSVDRIRPLGGPLASVCLQVCESEYSQPNRCFLSICPSHQVERQQKCARFNLNELLFSSLSLLL